MRIDPEARDDGQTARLPLTVFVGEETSDHEVNLVLEAFRAFDVTLDRGMYRFSDAPLPLFIGFLFSVGSGVLGDAAYEALTAAILRLRKARAARRITRQVILEIQRDRQFVVSDSFLIIRDSDGERRCDTTEEFFEELRRG